MMNKNNIGINSQDIDYTSQFICVQYVDCSKDNILDFFNVAEAITPYNEYIEARNYRDATEVRAFLYKYYEIGE